MLAFSEVDFVQFCARWRAVVVPPTTNDISCKNERKTPAQSVLTGLGRGTYIDFIDIFFCQYYSLPVISFVRDGVQL